MSFLSIVRPKAVTGAGLFDCLQDALKPLDIDISESGCSKLIGIGTDGASANVAMRGLKGFVEEKLPHIFFMWCLAHRLELALCDALKNTLFDSVDDLLLRLYYIYKKSPKKCQELADIIHDLQECLDLEGAGIRPIRSSGSRWVAHKLNAMQRVLSKYGAYTNHLLALSKDPSVQAVDRARLNGYYMKWINSKC